MADDDKKWIKPELIVLVRNKPEESVLLGCKIPGNHMGPFPAGSNPNTSFKCNQGGGTGGDVWCNDNTGS